MADESQPPCEPQFASEPAPASEAPTPSGATTEPKSPSEWARKRAAGRARRQRAVRRREAYFDLLVSGYSVAQIATATKTDRSSVRRSIAQALSQRRLDSQEDFLRLHVARLNKALRCADMSLERGELKAIAPFLQVLGQIGRMHGLDAAAPLQFAPPAGFRAVAHVSEPPPLALAHTPAETLGEATESRVKEVLSP